MPLRLPNVGLGSTGTAFKLKRHERLLPACVWGGAGWYDAWRCCCLQLAAVVWGVGVGRGVGGVCQWEGCQSRRQPGALARARPRMQMLVLRIVRAPTHWPWTRGKVSSSAQFEHQRSGLKPWVCAGNLRNPQPGATGVCPRQRERGGTPKGEDVPSSARNAARQAPAVQRRPKLDVCRPCKARGLVGVVVLLHMSCV